MKPIRPANGANRLLVYRKEDGCSSFFSGVPESGQSQMFDPIIDSEQLYRQLQSGNRKARKFVWEQGHQNVVPLLRALGVFDPEDVWQDTWIELILTRFRGYDPSRSKLSKWIIVRTTSRAQDRQRARLRERTISIEELSDVDELSILAWYESDDAENESGYQEKKKLLMRALRALKPAERKLLWLTYGQDQKSKTLAKTFGTTTTTIRKRISRARKRLREEIERLRKDERRRPIKKSVRADSQRPRKREPLAETDHFGL
jgi:RNA polymerase sigma-70 factor (ECF subfamily)